MQYGEEGCRLSSFWIRLRNIEPLMSGVVLRYFPPFPPFSASGFRVRVHTYMTSGPFYCWYFLLLKLRIFLCYLGFQVGDGYSLLCSKKQPPRHTHAIVSICSRSPFCTQLSKQVCRGRVWFFIFLLNSESGRATIAAKRRGIILEEANPMSGVFRNIEPPPPSSPPGECVSPAFGAEGRHTRWLEGGGGQ